jgi:phage-related protein
VTEDASAGRLYAEVVADVSGFRRDLQDKIEAETAGIKVQIAAEIDAKKLAAQTEVAAKAASERAKITAQVDAETARAETEIDAMRQRQSRQPIEVPVKADEKSLKALEKRLDSVGKKLVSASKVTGLLSGIPIAAGYLTNLAGGLFSLTSSLSQTTGLLAAIPGLATTAAQGIGALVLGLSGIKDAVKELDKVPPGMQRTKAQTEALIQALKGLTPEGRRFALFISRELEPQFKKLRSSVQSALLPGLQSGIKSALPLLGTLRVGLTDTAGRMGALAREAGALTGRPLFRADFASIMASNNRALTSFGHAGLNLVDALRNVMVVAEPLVERIGALAERFSETALQASNAGRYSGRMAAFFDRAWDAGSKLWGIIKNVSTAIYNLGKSARPSGDTLLDSLADAAQKLRDWTADPKNQQSIKDFFDNAVPVMQQTGDLLNNLLALLGRFGTLTGGNTLKGLFGTLNSIVNVLDRITRIPGGGPALAAIFQLSGAGLALGVTSKVLSGIVGNLKTLSTLSGGALGILSGGKLGGGAGTTAFQKLSSAWDTLRLRALYAGDALKTGATAIGNAASAAGRGATKVAGFVAEYAKLTGRAALDGLKAAGSGIAGVGQAAGKGSKQLGTFASRVTAAGGRAAVAGLQSTAGAIRAVGAAALSAATSLVALTAQYARATAAAALNAVRTLAVAAAQRIVRAATLAWTAVQWALNAAMDANPITLIAIALAALVAGVIYAYTHFTTFRNIVNAIFNWLKTAVVAVINFVRDHWRLILAIVLGPLGILIGQVTAHWKAISNAVSAAINFVINFVKNHWKLLISIILGPLGVIIALVVSNWSKIKNAFSSAISWVTSKWKAFWDKLGSLATSIARSIGNKINSFLSAAKSAFSRGVTAIGNAWARLKSAAKAPVNFVIGTVYNKGIRKLWNTVMGWLHLKGLQLGELPLLASGGPMPIKPGMFNRPTAIVGEGRSCIARGTLIETSTGKRAIEDVSPGEYVRTRSGWMLVNWSGLTRPNAEVLRLSTASGHDVVCTPDHQVWVGRPGTSDPGPSIPPLAWRAANGASVGGSGANREAGRCGGISGEILQAWTPLGAREYLREPARYPLLSAVQEGRGPRVDAAEACERPGILRAGESKGQGISAPEARWREARAIVPGDWVWVLVEGELHASHVTSVTLAERIDTYDLAVEGEHEFVAGGILVHNSYPEYVIPTDPKYRSRALALWAAAGGDLQMMAGGGVLGSILSGVKKVAGTVGSIAEEAFGLLTNPKKAWDALVHKFVAVKNFAGPWGSAISAIPKKLLGEVWTAASQILTAFSAGYGSDARGVVAAAKKYLGKGDDRGPNNNIFTRGWGMPGAPWCAMFVSTAIRDAHAGNHYKGYPSAAVRSFLLGMKHVPILGARPGDLATYHNGGHINIVESANPAGAAVSTIGGNENALVTRGTRVPQAVLRPMARGGILSDARRIFGYEAAHTMDSHEGRTPLIDFLSRLTRSTLGKVVGALMTSGLQVTSRDSGGPIYPGRSLIDNGTGSMEWALTPEALALIGGPRGGAALNSLAARVYRSRGRAPVQAATAGAARSGMSAQVNVFPQPQQSEHEIGMVAARKLGAMIR